MTNFTFLASIPEYKLFASSAIEAEKMLNDAQMLFDSLIQEYFE